MINLIGISGRIYAGKDLFAKMFLLAMYNNVYGKKDGDLAPTPEVLSGGLGDVIKEYEGWEIKKFATPLKQVASLILGVSIEQFEDREYKASTLGSEWDYFTVAREGSKDSHRFPEFATWQEADEYCLKFKGNLVWTRHQITVRLLLQRLGTDAIRNGLHGNTWINAMFSKYVSPVTMQEAGNKRDADLVNNIVLPCKWIITDVRFENEAQAIKDRGGIIIRISRGGEPGEGLHESETALDNWNFDWRIDNNGSLQALYTQAMDFLSFHGIIASKIVTQN